MIRDPWEGAHLIYDGEEVIVLRASRTAPILPPDMLVVQRPNSRTRYHVPPEATREYPNYDLEREA